MQPLDPFVIPGSERVFVLGALERNVSIQLQQVRALNLVWLLAGDGRLTKGTRVAVLGGGFAGMTFAAGAARRGARVQLFERGGELLAWQRRNRTRWIHPHIHEWPAPGCEEPRAGLPVCDWGAGLAADMAADVLAGFEAAAVDVTFHAAAATIDTLTGGFDLVILALGLGVERSFGALPLASYWADDAIDRVGAPGAPTVTHLVSGTGEGGVIDALYLCLAPFSHAAIAAALRPLEGMTALGEALLALDAEAGVDALDTSAASRHLSEGYAGLRVPAAADEVLRARTRRDTRVILNGPDASPLSPTADRLNRFLIARLLAQGTLTYRPGKITDLTSVAAGAGQRVTFADGGSLDCDRVHLRHGTVPALAEAYPELWARYRPWRVALPFDVPRRLWEAGFFGAR